MRKQFMIFLTALLFVFSLAACGSDQKPDGQNSTNQNSSESSTNSDSATGGSQTGGTANSGASTNSGSGSGSDSMQSGGNGGNGGGNGGNGSTGTNDAVGDTLFGDDSAGSASGGGTARTMGTGYEQMLRNAQVHDTDGDLSDLENDYTPGSLGW